MRDGVPVRLGGLAANLARINSFSSQSANREAVAYLLEESKFFIEWVAVDTEIDVAASLVRLQVELAGWQRNWNARWEDTQQRMMVAQQARQWSERVLEMSGLLASA